VNEHSDETGMIAVLLRHFEAHQIPRALDIKEKVDRGDALNDWDISVIRDLLDEANRVEPLVNRHTEMQALYAYAVRLYDEITATALMNERAGVQLEAS
jgi:hypothetical protein